MHEYRYHLMFKRPYLIHVKWIHEYYIKKRNALLIEVPPQSFMSSKKKSLMQLIFLQVPIVMFFNNQIFYQENV